VIGAQFDCLIHPSPAQEISVVASLLGYGWESSLLISFSYYCGFTPPLLGLEVGTSVGAADVAQDGTPIAPWNTTRRFTPDAGDYILALFFQVTRQQAVAVEYFIDVTSDDEKIMSVNSASITNGQLGNSSAAQSFICEILCLQPGSTRTLFQLSMADYVAVQVMFVYTCSPPLVNVGLEPGGMEIIAQGSGNPTVRTMRTTGRRRQTRLGCRRIELTG
jgi:hypothetical protein